MMKYMSESHFQHGLLAMVAGAARFGRILLLGLLVVGSSLPLTSQNHTTTTRKLITKVEPEYPETLKRLYIGGTVRLEITISPAGAVQNATLLGGNPVLGQSAIVAVKKWKYEPSGSRIKTEVVLEFDPHR
jgi:TonB family protein